MNKTQFTTVQGKPVNETELLHKIKSLIDQAEEKAEDARATTDLAWDTQVQRATIDMFIDSLHHDSMFNASTLQDLSKKGNILAIIDNWITLYKLIRILESTYSNISSLVNHGELFDDEDQDSHK